MTGHSGPIPPPPPGYQSYAQQLASQPPIGSAQPDPSSPARPAKRRWVAPAIIGAVALVAGAVIGNVSAGSPTESTEYRTLASQLADAKTKASGLEEQVGELQGQVQTATDAASTAAEEAETKTAELDEREAALDGRSSDLDEREAAVQTTEEQVAANTITEGTWIVGVDIEPGTYRTTEAVSEAAMCYWAIYTTGTNKDDIVQNDLPTGGSPSVTLSAGQDFETKDCGSWAKQ